MGEFFTTMKLPALTTVYVCRKCGALVAPLVDGGDGSTLHRLHHGSVDSRATTVHPWIKNATEPPIAHPGDQRA